MARIPLPEAAHLPDVLDGLAENPALPDDVAVRLLAYRRGYRLARVRSLPRTVAAKLARDPDPAVRAALAEHARPEGGGHGRFAADPDAEVRRALAGNPLLSPELMAALAADPEAGVRAAAAAAWTDPPEEALRALLTDPDRRVRSAACARRPPRDLYDDLLSDPDTRLRVVPFLQLDSGTAARLAADPDEEMRRRVAGHPDLAAGLRDLLARDADATVRGAVFERATPRRNSGRRSTRGCWPGPSGPRTTGPRMTRTTSSAPSPSPRRSGLRTPG